ncbi:bis(5'-nucleosyl)-tetraphosphatase (symmetrical) YqeK [uncultured Anaerococcus sp.]|uniref:bis(5'-nucleosyl)-tetraphosphatase (symmetrical) YqeK n=1 Tax=uncultured Anaerococcus sp. TaxID=293428 RepID=UPI0025F4FFD2|nr:bis(5'-nucleosyl)-tetraphosphatase (symmetrical) YqeK [uncultured Anaerococcus sp.]
MHDLDYIKEKILEDIGEKRYNHSLRVAKTASNLAKIYGLDEEKAYLAGVLHDCAKYNEKKYIDKLYIDISNYPVSSETDPVLHSFLGAELAKKVYNINDEDLLSAISFHTTGKANMSKLEKIIFIADAIEPARDFKGIEDIRKESVVNLDETMLMLLDSSIKFLISKKSTINPLSIEARNYLIEEKNGKTRHNS